MHPPRHAEHIGIILHSLPQKGLCGDTIPHVTVEIAPSGTGRRAVLVDGQAVGELRYVSRDEAGRWHDYRGVFRGGCRWLPVGVSTRVDGPQTPADAALLLLALLDYDREAAIRALYGQAA